MTDLNLRRFLFASLFWLAGTPTYADESGVPLALADAQLLAVEQQPMLEAQAAAVKAARDEAVASAQLPDPKLTGGVTDWPIDGPDRYSLRRDNFTMVNVGIEQDFPRIEKRRLRGMRGEHAAELAEQALAASRLAIERDVALAWLEVWRPERALELTHASLHEAELQLKATEIAYTSSRATQAEVLAARVTLGLLRDEAASLEDEGQIARSKLSRWIGADAAQRLLYPDLPQWTRPAPLQEMLVRLRNHPHLNTEAKRVAIAQDEVALARQAYKPDWSAGISYGYRPDFSDYVSLNFSVDLPVFTGQRQDRSLSGKLAEQSQAEQSREDMFRQEEAELRVNWLGWQRLQERIRQFDADILSQSQQRVDATLAAWQAGQGTLTAVLDARRIALDNRMKRLQLATDAARYRVALQYFAGESL
ncbi:MAG: TolC family protein [Nevskiaceae bacterium]|nr:MAG: TolC family protein [Nevskiaceae bacterium]